MSRSRIPRRMTLVWLKPSGSRRQYPFLKENALVFLSEIPNMPGWCVLAGCETGRIYAPYETKNFVELKVRKLRGRKPVKKG